MTPGFGKPRSELPWLPYESLDRVIINSHNFTPAFNPAVNGKMPTHVWCPSRDTAGNGTATLTDLVGSNNGTLTLMDPATDWVVDTDAGGVRALDFDGSNDRVAFGAGALVSTLVAFSVSAWVKTVNLTTNQYPKVITLQSAQGSTPFEITLSAQFGYAGVSVGADGSSWGRFRNNVSWVNSAWQHVVITYSGASATTASAFRIYVNNSVVTPIAALSFSALGNTSNLGSPSSGGSSNRLFGRLDDVRLWSGVALDGTDVADLYASGVGRGVSA
jgi:hypothetical protein